MYYFNTTDEQGNEHDCRLVKIVDDLGFSESDSSQAITKRTVAMLTKRYGKMTHDLNPSSFAGYRVNITRSATHTEVCLSQEQKVVEAARKYLPELLDGITPTQLLTGKQLEQALDNLALPVVAVQKMTQRIIGDLKYFERGSMPRLTRMVHRLSCVMGFPPASGLICAQSVLAVAYEHRHDTITFGTINASSVRPPPQNGQLSNCLSHGAPAQLECSADAALAPVIVYSILLTFAGASIAHVCKKIGTAVGSTHDAENIATVKASELLVYARVVLKALGVEPQVPTLLLTDNLSNQRVSHNAQSSARSRYYLMRSTCLHQRVTDGELAVVHIPDGENPSDFLTKFIPAENTNKSVVYSSGTTALASQP
jgi:hypothetical protein